MDCMELQKETKLSSGTSKYDDQKKKRHRYKSDSDHFVRKRQPPKLFRKKNDFYVTNKSNFKGQIANCDKLLEKGENEIVIHALGAAVPRAINLALQLKETHHGMVELAVNTSTVGVVDDLEPANDSATYETQTSHKSSVHIRVFRTLLR